MTSKETESPSKTRRHHRQAWLVPSAAVATAQTFGPDLIHKGLHPMLVMALSFYLGVLGGVAWQSLNRCDFVDRFVGWALLLLAITLLPLFAPGSTETNGGEGAWSFPGVIVGVVLAEGWMRQRHRP